MELSPTDFSALSELFQPKKHIDWSNPHDRFSFYSSLNNQEFSVVKKRIKDQFKHIIKGNEFWEVFFSRAGASDYLYTTRNIELAINELLKLCLAYRQQARSKKARTQLPQRKETVSSPPPTLPPSPPKVKLHKASPSLRSRASPKRGFQEISPPPSPVRSFPSLPLQVPPKRVFKEIVIDIASDDDSQEETVEDQSFSTTITPLVIPTEEFQGIYPSFPSTLLQTASEPIKETEETDFLVLPPERSSADYRDPSPPSSIATPDKLESPDLVPCFGYSSPEGFSDEDFDDTPRDFLTNSRPLVTSDDEDSETLSSTFNQIAPPSPPLHLGDMSLGLDFEDIGSIPSNLDGILHSMPLHEGFVRFQFTREVFKTLPSCFKEGLSRYEHQHSMSYALLISDLKQLIHVDFDLIPNALFYILRVPFEPYLLSDLSENYSFNDFVPNNETTVLVTHQKIKKSVPFYFILF